VAAGEDRFMSYPRSDVVHGWDRGETHRIFETDRPARRIARTHAAFVQFVQPLKIASASTKRSCVRSTTGATRRKIEHRVLDGPLAGSSSSKERCADSYPTEDRQGVARARHLARTISERKRSEQALQERAVSCLALAIRSGAPGHLGLEIVVANYDPVGPADVRLCTACASTIRRKRARTLAKRALAIRMTGAGPMRNVAAALAAGQRNLCTAEIASCGQVGRTT
jgi:hypothetical protein